MAENSKKSPQNPPDLSVGRFRATKCNRARWSDNDHYFGPFTYARDDRGYRPTAVVLGSGDGGDYPGCQLRLSAFGHTLIAALPSIVKPWRRKVFPTGWDAATIARLGRDWYWDSYKREYGFSISDGLLIVFLGRQTLDSSTEQSWAMHLPWTCWRHVRYSLYDTAGDHYWTEPKGAKVLDADYRDRRAIEDACPVCSFDFKDYDGEALRATTRIEEREWRFGEGWFKWLSIFRLPRISRSLYIRFSSETGPRKGSWKGGTIGHGIEILPGELHEAGFRRYCAENNMIFIEAK